MNHKYFLSFCSAALLTAGTVVAAPVELAPTQMDRITAGLGAAALVNAVATADFQTLTNAGTFTRVITSPVSRFNPLGGMSAVATGHALALGVGSDSNTDTQIELAVDVPGGKVYSIEIHAQGNSVEIAAAAKIAVPQPYNPLSP